MEKEKLTTIGGRNGSEPNLAVVVNNKIGQDTIGGVELESLNKLIVIKSEIKGGNLRICISSLASLTKIKHLLLVTIAMILVCILVLESTTFSDTVIVKISSLHSSYPELFLRPPESKSSPCLLQFLHFVIYFTIQ